MTKQLLKAIGSGKVVVRSRIAGEVMVMLPNLDGPGHTAVTIGGYQIAEISPKHIPASMVTKSKNLVSLIERGALKVL